MYNFNVVKMSEHIYKNIAKCGKMDTLESNKINMLDINHSLGVRVVGSSNLLAPIKKILLNKEVIKRRVEGL